MVIFREACEKVRVSSRSAIKFILLIQEIYSIHSITVSMPPFMLFIFYVISIAVEIQIYRDQNSFRSHQVNHQYFTLRCSCQDLHKSWIVTRVCLWVCIKERSYPKYYIVRRGRKNYFLMISCNFFTKMIPCNFLAFQRTLVTWVMIIWDSEFIVEIMSGKAKINASPSPVEIFRCNMAFPSWHLSTYVPNTFKLSGIATSGIARLTTIRMAFFVIISEYLQLIYCIIGKYSIIFMHSGYYNWLLCVVKIFPTRPWTHKIHYLPFRVFVISRNCRPSATNVAVSLFRLTRCKAWESSGHRWSFRVSSMVPSGFSTRHALHLFFLFRIRSETSLWLHLVVNRSENDGF